MVACKQEVADGLVLLEGIPLDRLGRMGTVSTFGGFGAATDRKSAWVGGRVAVGLVGQQRDRGERTDEAAAASHAGGVHVKIRQYDLVRASQQKRHGVEPGAVRDRRGAEMRVAFVELIDVGSYRRAVAFGNTTVTGPWSSL
jgi:hypothetical protein